MKKRSIKEIKRECVEDRKAFKRELYEILKQNEMLALLFTRYRVHITYDRHIRKVWKKLEKHPNVNVKNVLRKDNIRRETVWEILLYLGCEEMVREYMNKIPEKFAMGDAIEVAYAVGRKKGK